MHRSSPAPYILRCFSVLICIVIVLAACSSDDSTGEAQPVPSANLTSQSGGYYSGVSEASPEALRSLLQDLLETSQTRLRYTEVWSALQYTDEDPSDTNNVILLYSGRSIAKTDRDGQPGSNGNSWNREHVWPKSLGLRSKNQAGHNDIHHIRPTDKTVNSSRGNSDFDIGGEAQSEAPDTYSDRDSWEPRDEVKGDIARMLFYMDVRYDGGDGNMPDLRVVNDTSSTSGQTVLGVLCTLYDWHWEDPVDSFELRRNDRIEELQGNRNPFVDHPGWVEKIYGEECLK